jgi:hypothetical protein
VSTQCIAEVRAEVGGVNSARAERIQRMLTAILESGLPVPALNLADGLTPAVLDAIQAAILHVELAKHGRFLRT